MSTILDLEPKSLWHYFHQLTQIPRPSHHEEAVQQFVLDEATRLGLDAERDAAGNIRVRKAASPGKEGWPGVILQAHLDMVPQKNGDKVHDFTKDPITTIVGDDGWVRADGTTLGADNGLGVAAILAVLADERLIHPPLEALFTASEETGMTGAKGLQGGWLNGKYLINLDYEEEGELCIGCAGGLDGSYTLPFACETVALPGYRLTVRGLKGGHSGVDIHKKRGNAIKILTEALFALGVEHIADIHGGDLRNAIPREAEALIALPDGNAEAACATLQTLADRIKQDLNADDQGLVFALEAAQPLASIIAPADTRRLLAALRDLPNGIDAMSESMPGLVETSTNLASIRCQHDGARGELHLHCLLRSSNNDGKKALAERMAAVIEQAGGSAHYDGDYGGWLPLPESALVRALVQSGEAVYGHKPPLKAIHAGLECGILAENYPLWQMIAFGPTIESPHSPDERAHIESTARFYQWLIASLGTLAA
ncbi:MAG: aminoacyl-histidine dipeptidase [Cardiobacteriaceae bacterium]|nr:aminoacyl-histidine dipeptidase [Cardiobacteriaceae bacterium]